MILEKSTLLTVTLSLLVVCSPAQIPDPNVPTQANLGTTVSVAGLRIPEKAWEHYRRARAASLANDDSTFTRETTAALAVEPRFAALYVLRASRKVRMLHYESAIEDLLIARQIEPNVAWSGIALASAYNGLHHYVDAFLVLNSLRAPESTTWQAAYEFARSATGRADAEDALHWSALTLKIAPPNCLETHLLRGNALQLAHRPTEAVRELRLYLAGQSRPHPEVLVAIANIERESPEIAAN